MELDTKESGMLKIIPGMVKATKYGQMARYTKDIGEMTKQMDVAD